MEMKGTHTIINNITVRGTFIAYRGLELEVEVIIHLKKVTTLLPKGENAAALDLFYLAKFKI